MRAIDDLLREAQEYGASDVHISLARPPFFRIDGKLARVGEKPIDAAELAEMMEHLLG